MVSSIQLFFNDLFSPPKKAYHTPPHTYIYLFHLFAINHSFAGASDGPQNWARVVMKLQFFRAWTRVGASSNALSFVGALVLQGVGSRRKRRSDYN